MDIPGLGPGIVPAMTATTAPQQMVLENRKSRYALSIALRPIRLVDGSGRGPWDEDPRNKFEADRKILGSLASR